MEDGTCSNPKLKGRKACLREGYCTGTGQSKDVDFSQFLTREECEDPDKRSNIDVVEPGYCTARRGAKGIKLHFNFRQFRNKAHCENPESRKKPIDLAHRRRRKSAVHVSKVEIRKRYLRFNTQISNERNV